MLTIGFATPTRTFTQHFGKIDSALSMSSADDSVKNLRENFKIPVSETDPRFPSMLVGFNQRFIANKCKAVYLPNTPEECACALDDILENYKDGAKIRSGGHCYENFVMNDATTGIIDVGGLQDWGYDDEKGYYLSTGETNWSAFQKLFNNYGRVLPGGSCYSVGLGGHISGGGDGIMSRLYGTTVDSLTGIEIVVKDNPSQPAYVKYIGETSEKTDDANLFWACKGAGNGNFGIITKYYFKDLPLAPKGAIITDLAFKWGDEFNAENLKKILDEYVDFAARNDNRESSGKFQIYHEAAGESHMTIHTAYFDEATKKAAKEYHYELQRKLDDLYTVSPPSMFVAGHAGYWSRPARMDGQSKEDAVKDSLHDFPFYDATQNMNASGPNQRGKYKSAYMKERFPIEQVEAMIEHLRTVPEGLCPEDMKQSLLQIDCFGGRINDFEQKDAALGQRYIPKVDTDINTVGWEDDIIRQEE
eukprot:scaffold89849_cov68-Attheya_sp.AAC.3